MTANEKLRNSPWGHKVTDSQLSILNSLRHVSCPNYTYAICYYFTCIYYYTYKLVSSYFPLRKLLLAIDGDHCITYSQEEWRTVWLSPSRNISKRILTPKAQEMVWKKEQKDRRHQRIREFVAILCLLETSEATHKVLPTWLSKHELNKDRNYSRASGNQRKSKRLLDCTKMPVEIRSSNPD